MAASLGRQRRRCPRRWSGRTDLTYHPYFRGKQYELITIRENAQLLATKKFVPIIEPVREALGSLSKTLKAICQANGNAVVIVNPNHGDHAEDGTGITDLLKDSFLEELGIAAGVLLRPDTTVEEALACCERHEKHQLTLVHAGFQKAKELVEGLGGKLGGTRNVFLEKYCGKLYRKHFDGTERVLIRDGFERRRNKDHPACEPFSDLHVTYPDEGMDGFGDFLTVGDDFSDGGGPAYAVAIHLTFVDSDADDLMKIYHFVSDRTDTPTDPAGKFAEALTKMIKVLDSPTSKVMESGAVAEFRDLHENEHFPGLGYVKKLSMKHHIETLADYLP